MKRMFVLREPAHHASLQGFLGAHWQACAQQGKPLQIVVSEHKQKRSTEQNDRMWAMLGEVSRQVDWYGQRLEPEEWKDVFTAALRRQRVVPGLDGGFVALGASTRRMSVGEMSELMELMSAFGAERGVKFNDALAA